MLKFCDFINDILCLLFLYENVACCVNSVWKYYIGQNFKACLYWLNSLLLRKASVMKNPFITFQHMFDTS